MRLLITDLDNTLYDWVSFFAKAFEAMAEQLTVILGVDRQELFEEFKAVHRKYGDSEVPFAVRDLPSVRRRFGDSWKAQLDPALHAFNSARKRELRLYESVGDTLEQLSRRGIPIIGYTEALPGNAFYRLERLGIRRFFRRLYALEPTMELPLDSDREPSSIPEGFLEKVPRSERKPNPALLVDICSRERVSPRDAWYVGDSLSRDMLMARQAGVTAVWAEYGTRYDQNLWATLVKITHWTDEDVARDAELRKQARAVQADFTLQAFSDLLPLVERADRST
jgi:FMN phosphatase YigB (HAD superfamily)